MAWSTKTGINMRSTLAFITADPAGTVWAGNGGALTNPAYPKSLTVNANTFNAGWVVTATGNPIGAVDGARDRNAGVDGRLAGRQGATAGSTNCSYKIQAGTAPGVYKMWLGLCDVGATISPDHSTLTVRDSNGTLFTVTGLTTITAGNVFGADGTLYTATTLWAGTADTSGVAVQFTTSDTSNGNGGPFIFIDTGGSSNLSIPLAHVALQFQGATQMGSCVYTLP